jgi:hypothetical protein
MKTSCSSVRILMAALIFFGGLAAGLAQSGQPWPPGVRDIMKLEQANVGDDTVIAYIKSTVRQYKMNEGEIVMLKQQGFSDRVLAAMQEPKPAKQPRPVVKAVRVVRPARVAAIPPYYYPFNSAFYPYCWYPPVSLSFGWVSGGNCNGGYHGGSWNGYSGWHH